MSCAARLTATASALCLSVASLTGCGGPGRPSAARAAPARAVRANPTPTPQTSQPAPTTPSPAPGAPSSTPAAAPAPAPEAVPPIGPWTFVGRTDVFGPGSNQGLATVTGPDGATRTVYTGSLTISAALRAAGWVHVGDPDSWHGWLVEPFQGPDGATAKMFRVTSPQGRITDAVHPLSPGEAANNSFAAVTPDGQWTVSGEWGEEDRLLVFPTPAVNTGTRPGSPLPLSGTIALDRPVRDVQGCAFVSSTRLVCASSDPATDLWPVPDPLLQIDLAGPLSATSAGGPARVTLLGPIPLISPCPGTYEPEGVDMDRVTGILSLEVAPPGVCRLVTQVYRYRAPAGAGAAAGAASRAGAGSGAATATPTGTATGAPTGAASRAGAATGAASSTGAASRAGAATAAPTGAASGPGTS